MTADTRHTRDTTRRSARRWVACACMIALLTLVGCKSDKGDTPGTGVARAKDPLVHGPTRIPRQDLPVPDRATGGKTKPDPLTTPTGGKAGYTDDPERFKGTYIPGKPSTPAALAGRVKDDDTLKIDTPGVPLTPAGGTLPGSSLEAPEGVSQLYTQLERYGIRPEDRSLERENGQYVFRASVPIRDNEAGARRQYTGMSPSAPEAVKQVLTQLAAEPK